MKKTAFIVTLCGMCAIASFLVTLAAQPERKTKSSPAAELAIPARDWSRACATDPGFTEESKTLRASADTARTRLAELLDNPEATDESILAQVEQVIASHDQLERRVAQHLMMIRHQLSPEQQKQLMGLASESVRQGGYRWRGGRGPSSAPGTQESNHPGRRRLGRQGR